MKNSIKNKSKQNLLFISLSNQKTLQNSIHAYILNFLKNKFENIFVFCLGKKFRQSEDNIHYFSGNFFNWFSYLKRIKKIDYIYINDFFLGGLFGVFVKKNRKVTLLFRCGSPWRYELSSPSSIFKTLIVSLTKPVVIKNCDKVVYNSQAIVQKQYKHDWEVVYNGVDTKLFKPMKVKRISPKLNLLFIGNLNEEKGLKYLFKAVENIQDKVNLTIVGDGPLFNEYQKSFPYANYVGRVAQEKITKIINQHDILVHPSYVESFPNAPLEAMACGKPVIAANVYGVPEMIKEGYNGLLVPPKNSKAIRGAINAFIKNSSLIKIMGKNAKDIIKERFGKERQIQKLYKASWQ